MRFDDDDDSNHKFLHSHTMLADQNDTTGPADDDRRFPTAAVCIIPAYEHFAGQTGQREHGIQRQPYTVSVNDKYCRSCVRERERVKILEFGKSQKKTDLNEKVMEFRRSFFFFFYNKNAPNFFAQLLKSWGKFEL